MIALIVGMVVLFAGMGWAAEETVLPEKGASATVQDVENPSSDVQEEQAGHGFVHKLLLYVPNRVLDAFDILRLRARVGPGFAFSARATKPLSVFLGGYTSIYVGLPGPRLKPTIKLPVGLENNAGVGVSVLNATSGGGFGPDYSVSEIGAGFQSLIVGLDFGVDPIEVLDLATGFLFIDLRSDDL